MRKYCPKCDEWSMEPLDEACSVYECKNCGIKFYVLFSNGREMLRLWNRALTEGDIERLMINRR